MGTVACVRRWHRSRWCLVGLAAVVPVACSDGDAFDRPAAIAAVVDDTGWSEKDAGCWVDRVRDERGDDALEGLLADGVDASTDPDVAVDCVDPAALATAPEVSPTVTARPGDPGTYGDDPELDALWDACAAGDGAACDALFDAAPLGSEYERFGSTCGDRGVKPRCAE